jgi:DNA-binding transcriptional MocR family regulator
MNDYRAIANELALDIKEGRLRPGARLLPQREFADRRGIAASTASRVYAELVRRGLATGEVGRGTYVRAGAPLAVWPLADPRDTPVDLELIFPHVPEQAALLARSLAALSRRPDTLNAALRPVRAAGTPAARDAAAALLARSGWSPEPAHVWFAGSGKQAIAAVLAALCAPGERVGVEALTYPVVKSVAWRLGLQLVPIAMDREGLRPDSLAAAHKASPLRGVYLQPSLHNPLGVTMSEGRRAEIAARLRRLDLFAIEDAIYAFLEKPGGPPPLAAHAPERCVLVDSLSKRLAPGLTLGMIVAPADFGERVAASLRSGAWIAPGFALEAGTRWMADGTVATIVRAKRRDAAARQTIARTRLAGLTVSGDPRAYHCWLQLPDPWRAEPFVAAAARRGIAITPAAAFAIGSGHAPNAVRLALASPEVGTLSTALETIATLARGRPDAWRTE